MDRIVLNKFHETEVNAGQTVNIGSMCAAAAAGALDFDSLNDTLYGFYTTRKIEIVAIEHIATVTHACDNVAGIASLTDGTTVFATVTGVDAIAKNGHISGVLGTTVEVPDNTMLYMKVTTASTDSGTANGEGFFIVTYK